MKEIPKLPDSELKIMKILWEGHPDMSRMDIESAMTEEERLAPTTINTLLSRLKDKGVIKVKKRGRNKYYTSLITKKDYQNRESHLIIDNLFDGSLVNFVSALYDGQKIPKEKVEELEKFLQDIEQGN